PGTRRVFFNAAGAAHGEARGGRSLTEYSAGPRAWGLRIADKERGGERCGFIADDERRGMRPQSPCALRAPAAWGRLLRCRGASHPAPRRPERDPAQYPDTLLAPPFYDRRVMPDLKTLPRNPTRAVRIGRTTIGGGHPIAVQSMCATKTWDVE